MRTVLLGLTLAGASLTFLCADCFAGTIAVYDFSGNSLDTSGNGNHATVHGATLTTDRFGNADSAYFFDGANDSIATGLERSTYNEDFSISVWFQYTGAIGDYYRPLIGGQAGPFFLGKEAFNSTISMQNGNHVPGLAPGTDAWDGQWHHIAAVFDGTSPGSALTGSVYLDGTLVGSAGYSNAASAAGELHIGHEDTLPVIYFLGSIDDVAFFDNALTPTQITALATGVPEPGTLGLFGLGLAALGLRRRRSMKAS